jgi:hypothetical protein
VDEGLTSRGEALRAGSDGAADVRVFRRSDLVLAALLLAAAIAAIVGTAVRASDPAVGFALGAALDAIRSQLPVTLPAAVSVSFVVALDVAAGATVVRLLRGRWWRSVADAVLTGFVGAVILDAGLLFALSGFGAFRGPLVLFVLGVVAAVGAVIAVRSGGPIARPRWSRVRLVGLARAAFVAVVWVGPVLLTLASPVVPFSDVLPNHVAPAQHLLAFGSLGSLATDPSPIYGASRLFLGEIALLGTLTVATGLPAALAMAAFALPLLVISGIAMARSAALAFGRSAAFWALVAFPLSFTFVRLTDARDSVTALPLAAAAFALLVRSPSATTDAAPERGHPDWALTITLLATVLVHPLVGALATATVVVLTVSELGRWGRRAIPAVVGAAVAALPQVALMVGVGLPPVSGLVGFVAGAGAAGVTARIVGRRPGAGAVQIGRAVPAVLVVGVAIVVVLAIVVGPTLLSDLRLGFPVLFGLAALAAVGLVPTARGGRRLLLAGLGVGLGALVAVALVPGASLTENSIRYEVPKAIGYWLPWICVPAAAGLVAAIWRARLPLAGRAAFVGALLAVAVLPIGAAVPNTMQATHPAADNLAFDLGTAQRGYWLGYPDPRNLIDAEQRQVVDAIAGLERAGTWQPDDVVLHVTSSIQPWRRIPIGEFTGAIETIVAPDAAPTIFTTGPDLHPLTALAAQLAAHPRYVLLEPAGLPGGTAAQVTAAGYRPVFSNRLATLYEAAAAATP